MVGFYSKLIEVTVFVFEVGSLPINGDHAMK